MLGSPLTLPPHTPWISDHYQSGFRLLIETVVTEIREILDSSKNGNRCLHDILAGIDTWSSARTFGTTLTLPEDSSSWNRPDNEPATKAMQREQETEDARGQYEKTKQRSPTKEETEQDERRIEELERLHPPDTAAQAFDKKLQRYLTSNNFLAGHRLVFNTAIPPLNLIVHLLHDTTDVSDVLAYCAAPIKALRDRFAIVTAPFLWKEHESRLEPHRNRQSFRVPPQLHTTDSMDSPAAPGLLQMVPQDPDRNKPHQEIDNSILFHNVKLVVEYRKCPPDTCSGRAPIVANYPRVEFLIGRLVDLHFTRIAIPELDLKATEFRTKVLNKFLRRVTTFACETDDDKSRILALLEAAFVETAVNPTTFLSPQSATVTDVFALVGATFVSLPV